MNAATTRPEEDVLRREDVPVRYATDEATRRRLRRRMLWWSAPVVVILAVIAGWATWSWVAVDRAIGAYNGGDYGGAIAALRPLDGLNPDRFVWNFAEGTADAQLGNYATAEAELQLALQFAPNAESDCKARINLVTAYEAHADTLVNDLKQSVAVAQLRQAAQRLRNENPNQACPVPPPPNPDSSPSPTPTPSPPPSSSPSPSPSSSSPQDSPSPGPSGSPSPSGSAGGSDQQDQLNQAEKDARQRQQQQQQQPDNSPAPTPGPNW